MNSSAPRISKARQYAEGYRGHFDRPGNGSDLSRLTDDDARDWEARFIGRGDSVSFRSTASGTTDAWSIRRDGSDRTRLTNVPEGVADSVASPPNSL